MGGWSNRTKRKFIWRELRFEVQYSIPHVSLHWLHTEEQTDSSTVEEGSSDGPISLDRPLYCLSRSLDARDTLFFSYFGNRTNRPWKRAGQGSLPKYLREDQLWFIHGQGVHSQAKCSWLSLLEDCNFTNLSFHITILRRSRDFDSALRQINGPIATVDRRAFLALMTLFRAKWSRDASFGSGQKLLAIGPNFQISAMEVPSVGTVYKYSNLQFSDDQEINKNLIDSRTKTPEPWHKEIKKHVERYLALVLKHGLIEGTITFHHVTFQEAVPDFHEETPGRKISEKIRSLLVRKVSTDKEKPTRPHLKYFVRARWSPLNYPELSFVRSIPNNQLTLIRVMFNHFDLPFMTLRTRCSEEVKQSILGAFTNEELAEAVGKPDDDGRYPGIGELVACWGFPSMPRVVNEVSDSFVTVFSASSLGCPLGIPQIGHTFLGKGAWPTVAPNAHWGEVLDLIRQFWHEFDQFFSLQGSVLSQFVELYSDSRKYIEICVSLDLSQDWDENTNILYSASLKHSISLNLPRILYLLDYYFDTKIVAHGHDPSLIMSKYMLDIAVNRAERRPGRSIANSEQAMDMAEDTITLVDKLSGHCNPQGQQVYDKKQAELIVINRLVRGIIWILHNGNAPGKNSKTTATATSASGASEDRSLECSLSSSVLDESAGATICLA